MEDAVGLRRGLSFCCPQHDGQSMMITDMIRLIMMLRIMTLADGERGGSAGDEHGFVGGSAAGARCHLAAGRRRAGDDSPVGVDALRGSLSRCRR